MFTNIPFPQGNQRQKVQKNRKRSNINIKMVQCIAVGCNHRSERGYSMHVFPRHNPRRKIWIDNVNRKNYTPSNYACLCETHFEPDQFMINSKGNRRLKPTGIPTIFPHSTSLSRSKNSRYGEKKFQSQERLLLALREHDYAKSGDLTGIKVEPSSDVDEPLLDDDEELTTNVPDFLADEIQSVEVELQNIDHDQHLSVLELKEMKQICQIQVKAIEMLMSTLEEMHRAQMEPQPPDLLESRLVQIFRPDQIVALKKDSVRGIKWLDETIKQGFLLRRACGKKGYKTLLKQGYPLPSVRTLLEREQRSKTKKVKSKDGNNEEILVQ